MIPIRGGSGKCIEDLFKYPFVILAMCVLVNKCNTAKELKCYKSSSKARPGPEKL